jgi:hypothetical protein
VASEGELITPEHDLLQKLIRLYKLCRIESRAAKNVIDALSEKDPALGSFLKFERLKYVERAEGQADAEFRALEAALRDQRPYLSLLRALVETHHSKRPSQG